MTFAGGIACAVMLIGMAIDFGRGQIAHSRLQSAADAAAIAAAAPLDATTAERQEAAEQVFAANAEGFAGVVPTVRMIGDTVTITVSHHVATTFTRIAGYEEMPVEVSSSAAISTEGNPQCVLLLEKSIFGLYVNSDSTVDADCRIHINSPDKEALYVNSDSSVVSTGTCVVGDAHLNSGGTATPAPVEGCAEMADPLVSLPEPGNAGAACNHIDYTVNNGESRTMSPGVYCKKTLINSGGTAIMQPGVYVFREGPFEINSLSSVSGSGVMLFFADKDAYLKVNSDSTLTLSAPTSGTYAGMLMFQSRDPSTLSAPGSEVNSDSASKLEGTIYLPNGVLVINSHSDLNQSASYTAIIAKRMVVNSYGNFYLRSDFDGPTPLPPLLQSFRSSTAVRLTN